MPGLASLIMISNPGLLLAASNNGRNDERKYRGAKQYRGLDSVAMDEPY